MNFLRSLWPAIVGAAYWVTLLVVPRSVFWGESPPESATFSDAHFRVSRWAWLWPVAAVGIGLFLLAPYARERGAWLLARGAGLLLASFGAVSLHVLLNTRIGIEAGAVEFTRGGVERRFALAEITGVFSTPGYIHVRLAGETEVALPKVFADGARLLAMLRNQSPAARAMT